MIVPGMTKRKRSEHYVNNKEFLAALIEYRTSVEDSYYKEFGADLKELDKSERAKRWKGKPPIPRYVGECFLKIANHLSFKPNFVNYMFKEDMIPDILRTVFNTFITSTQRSPRTHLHISHKYSICFLRRIQREKRQLEIRTRSLKGRLQ